MKARLKLHEPTGLFATCGYDVNETRPMVYVDTYGDKCVEPWPGFDLRDNEMYWNNHTLAEALELEDAFEEDAKRFIEADACYRIQWYPATEGSAYTVYGVTFEEAMDEAHFVQRTECIKYEAYFEEWQIAKDCILNGGFFQT